MTSVPNDIVVEIFCDMSDPEAVEGGTGVFWELFRFLEISGFDVSVVRPWISSYIARWQDDHPESNFTPLGNEKEIAFRLRNLARQQASMPLLDLDEEENWRYEEPSFRTYTWDGKWPLEGAFESGDGERIVKNVIRELRSNHSDALRFAELVSVHNEYIEKSSASKSKIIHNLWISYVIHSCAANVVGKFSSWPPFLIALKVNEKLGFYRDR